jgi:hypothetical protein
MITSTLGRMATADKLSVQQLKQAVQDGTVPAYIGIPLIQEKMKQAQQATASQAGQAPQQPPIADQILEQANGVSALPSNMPMQYAHGGIIHMATGGYDPMAMARSFTRDDEEPEDMDFLNSLGVDELPETQEPEEEPELQGIQSDAGGISDLTPVSALAYAAPYAATRQADQVTVKQEGEPAQTVRKETARVERPAAARDLERLALAEGEKYKLNPALIKHVMFKETGGLKDKANAVSPAGAMGVMQLMPATAKELGVKDPFDPVQNIEGGVKYLAQMQNKYGDPKLAAIAYNWGPGRTDRWLAQGGDFSKLPKETQGYVKGMAEGGMTDDEDTDGLTVDLNDLDQMAAFDTNQLADVADDGIVSQFKSPPPKKESTVGKILEDTGISGLTNKAKELYYKSREGEKREQMAEEMAPGMLEKLTPEERARRKKNTKQLLENPKNAKVLSQKELADLFEKGYSDLPKQTDQSLLNEADRSLRAQPATSDSNNASAKEPVKELLPPQMSLRTAENDEEIRRSLAAQPEVVKKEAAEKPSDRAGYDELKQYFTKGIAGLEDQKKINAYMALLAGGLGIMGGSSPHAAVNIGQGAQAGIGAYLTGSKDIAAQNAAMMQGRLGLEKYQSLRDIQAEQIKSREAYHAEAEQRRRELAAATDARMREIAKGNLEQKQHLLEEKQFARGEAAKAQAARQIEAMEQHARVNARLAAQTLINKNPTLQFDAAQAQQLQSDLENKAMAGLYNNPAYLAQHKILNPEFKPGQIDMSSDLDSILKKYKR